jgi:hypothetical protein
VGDRDRVEIGPRDGDRLGGMALNWIAFSFIPFASFALARELLDRTDALSDRTYGRDGSALREELPGPAEVPVDARAGPEHAEAESLRLISLCSSSWQNFSAFFG